MMDLMEKIRERVKAGDYRFTFHGFERCTERKISPNEIEDVIFSGEIIENYPCDRPYPSCLNIRVDFQRRPVHSISYTPVDAELLAIKLYLSKRMH